MHSGIHTGLVVTGELDLQKGIYREITGDTINLASRLSDLAKAGEILVGPETFRRTQGAFAFQALASTQAEGKAGSIQVYKVLSVMERPATTRTGIGMKARPGRVLGLEMHGISSPLVGRDEEVSLLHDRIELLLSSQGGLLFLIGEAGLGKSRLMAEVRSHWKRERQPGALWLEGRALSFTQAMSYWPFQEILREYAGISEEDEEEEAWGKVEASITTLFPPDLGADDLQAHEVLPYLASMLALRVKGELEERVKYLDGEAMGRQIFLTSRRLFQRLAQQRPLILVFEDWQWADQSSANLLEHLVPLIQSVPLLICVVSRPDPESPAMRLRDIVVRSYPGYYTEIIVDALSPMESEKLLQNLMEIKDLPPHLCNTILHKAEGNPLFLEEVIRALVSMGAVVPERRTGLWKASAQIEDIRIPDTLQGVIMARVDRLEEEVKQLLRLASVIGRTFLYRVLGAIAEADRQLDHHLHELQRVELIREKSRVPELEYIFKHALIQEATYESILLKRRRELHAQVGQCLEALFADRLEMLYGLLAYHYARAENWEKAQEYLFKAGDQAGRLAADAEALAHYQQAMTAYGHAFGDQWEPLQRAQLERKMGEALFGRGEHQEALVCLKQALARCGKPLPGSVWGVRAATTREITLQLVHRLFPRWFVRPAGGPINPAVDEITRLYKTILWIDMFSNPERFLLLVLKDLNQSESNGDLRTTSVASAALGLALDFALAYRLGEGYLRRAMELASRAQDPSSIANALSGFAQHKLFLGELNAVLEMSGQAVEKHWELGDLHAWGMSAYQTIVARTYRGDLSEALIRSEKMVRFGQEGADPQLHCWGLWTQGFVQHRIGQFEKAVAVLRESAQIAKDLPDKCFCIMTHADLGRCYLGLGRLADALDALEVSQSYFAPYLGGDSYASLRNGRAEAFLAAAEQDDGAKRGAWLQKARAACREALKLEKEFRPGLPEAMRLQGTYEWLRDKPATAWEWWQRSLRLAEEMGQRYDLGMTHLEAGQRSRERAHLERAEAIFAEIGAEWNLARAREALSKTQNV
jgi:tetratricopeptide (TPR) repeat protein